MDVLKVRHIIICGHYGCGGVQAALENFRHGMIDNWLSGIRSLSRMHRQELDALPPEAAVDRLCELNVLAQARHVAHTTILEDAWERGQKISHPQLDLPPRHRPHHPAAATDHRTAGSLSDRRHQPAVDELLNSD